MAEKPIEKPGNRVLFRLFKGFIYGNVFGLIAGVAIFLLASAVDLIASSVTPYNGGLPITPAMFLLLIYAASVTTGVIVEYDEWLDRNR